MSEMDQGPAQNPGAPTPTPDASPPRPLLMMAGFAPALAMLLASLFADGTLEGSTPAIILALTGAFGGVPYLIGWSARVVRPPRSSARTMLVVLLSLGMMFLNLVIALAGCGAIGEMRG